MRVLDSAIAAFVSATDWFNSDKKCLTAPCHVLSVEAGIANIEFEEF